jgi:hypothetical protein
MLILISESRRDYSKLFRHPVNAGLKGRFAWAWVWPLVAHHHSVDDMVFSEYNKRRKYTVLRDGDLIKMTRGLPLINGH